MGENSPSLDNAGRPLVDLVVGILRNECHYNSFHCYAITADESGSKFGIVASLRTSSETSLEHATSDRTQSAQRHLVMFSPSLISRLGSVARKLVEVIDTIHKSSSPELANSTEIWRQQWHNEAYSFIANISDQKDTRRTCSLAACNRLSTFRVLIYSINVLESLLIRADAAFITWLSDLRSLQLRHHRATAYLSNYSTGSG